MAYTIKYGNDYLFYPGSDTALAHDAKLSQKSGGSYSTLTFTIPPDNPLYETVKLHDVDNQVVLAFDDTILFRGVITGIRQTMWLEQELTCASELIFLDWVQTRYKPYGLTARTCLAELVAIYNSYARLMNANGLDRFLFTIDTDCLNTSKSYCIDNVGYVNPDNPSGARLVDCETSTPTSILQIIRNGMVDDYGAFLRVRYIKSTGPVNIPYRAIGLFSEAPDGNEQVIQLGENLMDYDYVATDEGMYNACLPVGGTMDTEEAYAAPARLTVAVNSMIDSTTVSLTANSGTVTLDNDGVLLIDGGVSYVVVGGPYTVGSTAVDVQISPRAVYSIPTSVGVTYVGKNPFYHDKALTLNRIPNGTSGGYVHDSEIVYNLLDAQQYGIKCMTYRDSSIKDANALLNKAIAMIGPCRRPRISLKVSAIDAAYYSDSYEHLQAGQVVRVISEPHGLNELLYVVSADIDLQNPENTRYQLGWMESTLSRMLRDTSDAVGNETSNTMIELNNTIPESWIRSLS